MKNNVQKVAFGAVCTALAVVSMLLSYIPACLYLGPIVAAAIGMCMIIENGRVWGVPVYVATALLSLLICNKESAIIFTFSLGYYPILKGLLEEKVKNVVVMRVMKQVVFNVGLVLCILFIGLFIGLNDYIGKDSVIFNSVRITVAVLIVAFNIVFVIYDMLLTRIVVLYVHKIHPLVKRAFRL